MSDDGLVAKLLLGSEVERQLAAGEVHGYEIRLPAGRFLGARLEQQGVDVVVKILDPSGAVLRRHDSPTGGIGLESVSFIPARAGLYRVEVSSFDRLAFPGKYRLRLEGPRIPRKEDRVRIAAEEELERATALFDEGSAGAIAAAAAAYGE